MAEVSLTLSNVASYLWGSKAGGAFWCLRGSRALNLLVYRGRLPCAEQHCRADLCGKNKASRCVTSGPHTAVCSWGCLCRDAGFSGISGYEVVGVRAGGTAELQGFCVCRKVGFTHRA
jgi:hypothetical protein